MRTAKRLSELLLLIDQRGGIIRGRVPVKLIIPKLNTGNGDSLSRLIFGLEFIGLPGIRPWSRMIKGIFLYMLLHDESCPAETAKLCFRTIEFSAVLARVHIDLVVPRSITHNSRQLFDYRNQLIINPYG